jgi:hypothetical protein
MVVERKNNVEYNLTKLCLDIEDQSQNYQED